MTRFEFITSDEYIKTYIECIVVSKKSVSEMRKELNEFLLKYRDELLYHKCDCPRCRGESDEDDYAKEKN